MKICPEYSWCLFASERLGTHADIETKHSQWLHFPLKIDIRENKVSACDDKQTATWHMGGGPYWGDHAVPEHSKGRLTPRLGEIPVGVGVGSV